jgi:hypothetical protein
MATMLGMALCAIWKTALGWNFENDITVFLCLRACTQSEQWVLEKLSYIN